MSELPPPPPPAAATVPCAWHPERAAGRRCTRCQTPTCSDCLRPASVGSICPTCVRAAKPDVATRARRWQAAQGILVTRTIIAINLGVFVIMTMTDPGMLSGRTTALHLDLGLSRLLVDSPVDLWRMVSAGFIHFGIIHLGFNMYLLFQLGSMLEPAVGRLRFTGTYLASLLGGAVGALVMQPNGLHGGASGAVFGLMGFAAIGYWRQGINPLRTPIGSLLMLNLFITFVVPGISIGGHLGGAVAGAVVGGVATDRRYRGTPEAIIVGGLILGSIVVGAVVTG